MSNLSADGDMSETDVIAEASLHEQQDTDPANINTSPIDVTSVAEAISELAEIETSPIKTATQEEDRATSSETRSANETNAQASEMVVVVLEQVGTLPETPIPETLAIEVPAAELLEAPVAVAATTEASEMSVAEVAAVELPDMSIVAEPAVELSETTSAKIPTVEPITDATPVLRPRKKKRRVLSLLLLALLLAGILIPLIVGLSYGISAYNTYNILRAHASSGAQHLLDVKTLFSGNQGHLSNVLASKTLVQAGKDFSAARQDFEQVQYLLEHTQVISLATQFLPQYRPQVAAAHTASLIGIDASEIGQDLIATASQLAPRLRGPLLSNSQTPLITSADLTTIGNTINQVQPLVTHIQTLSRTLSINVLPLSAHQRTQVEQLLQLLPQVQTYLQQGHTYLDMIGWLLGVNDGQRTFLVQTMDRAELRATGGFTGQYGELHINAGRIEPFSLRDISLVEYTDNSPTSEKLAPASYRSWWPFANWGLRDSNLSADFPTSAQIAMNQYQIEVGHHVDGVILFTPVLIENVLQVTGPLKIPGYNEIITSQNLEQRLHYYQLDNAGIAKQQQLQGNDTSTSDRKRFTSLVASTLMNQVRQAPLNEVLSIAHQMLYDLQSRDLQIYLANTQAEDFLMQHNSAGQIDTSTKRDGLYIVQANVSASKASQYVRTTMHDTVTLDSGGGATHVLQIRLAYDQIGPVYGLDTYRDYMRVYVPPSAHLLWGDGFDTGTALCGGPLAPCASDGVYPNGELLCPNGLYDAGYAAPILNDPYNGEPHPLDTIGPPTNLQSDQPGRAMFGGYVVIPKNCVMTVTLSWYAPATTWQGPYTLYVQRQSGTYPELSLTVQPYQPDCASSLPTLYFDGLLTQDRAFTLPSSQDKNVPCIAQPET